MALVIQVKNLKSLNSKYLPCKPLLIFKRRL
nr:MAG TPA: hypothetical protein [Caudoviricetes sp.]